VIALNTLVVLTSVLAVVAILSVWANRLLFNPDNWSSTSTQLLANPDIRSATSNYVVDQLYANVNVAGAIRSGLPPQFQALAGPVSGALRNAAVQGVNLALQRPRVQSLWANANRAADQAFIAIVNGGTKHVGVNNGTVTLNLGGIVEDVAARLGLPANLSSHLPPNVAQLTILQSNHLKTLQDVGNLIRHLALWLTILVPVLYGLAIVLARGYHRRMLMTVGIAITISGLAGLAARAMLESGITNNLVHDASLRPAVRATIAIGTAQIRDIATGFIVVGLASILAAWFAGPARYATAGRRAIAPYLREHPGYCFAVAAGLMVLVFIWQPFPATGTPVGIVVFLALAMAGTELLRRQTDREFPAPQPDALASPDGLVQA
jgi:hypothetical protein